jgi:hypothetical protein
LGKDEALEMMIRQWGTRIPFEGTNIKKKGVEGRITRTAITRRCKNEISNIRQQLIIQNYLVTIFFNFNFFIVNP